MTEHLTFDTQTEQKGGKDVSMKMSSQTQKSWQAYLATLHHPEEASNRFYDVFGIGNTVESKNEGARLILAGKKTTTSGLLWDEDFAENGLPTVGALSVLEDGHGKAVCIVETIAVETKPFSAVDEQFARDYGEWGDTLESWREHAWAYYASACKQLGKDADEDMPLVCERFRVVHQFA